MSQDILVAGNIEVAFGGGRRLFGSARPEVKVLRGVSVRIGRGETVGIDGESG